MLDNTLKEMADKAVEAFTTGYVQLEPINPLSPATGGVAATKGLPELNVDAMILDVYLNGGEYSFKMEDGVVVDIHGTEDKSTVNVVCSPPEPKRKGQEE